MFLHNCLETTRVLSRDWVVRHKNRGYQVLARGPARRYCAPGSRVLVRETEDGHVRLLVQAVDGRTHELEWAPVALPVAPRPLASTLDVATAGACAAVDAAPVGAPAAPAATRQSPTPAQLGYRARLNAQDTAHFARQRGFKAYNARRRAEALARAGTR